MSVILYSAREFGALAASAILGEVIGQTRLDKLCGLLADCSASNAAAYSASYPDSAGELLAYGLPASAADIRESAESFFQSRGKLRECLIPAVFYNLISNGGAVDWRGELLAPESVGGIAGGAVSVRGPALDSVAFVYALEKSVREWHDSWRAESPAWVV